VHRGGISLLTVEGSGSSGLRVRVGTAALPENVGEREMNGGAAVEIVGQAGEFDALTSE